MKYIFFAVTILVLQKVEAQDNCKLFSAIFEIVGRKYQRFVLIDEVRPEKYSSFPKFDFPIELALDSTILDKMSAIPQTMVKDSSISINSCSLDLPIINSSQFKSISNKNLEIRANTDTSIGRQIDKRVNEILTIRNEQEKWRLYNKYMATPLVMNYHKKISDSSTFIVKLSRPIVYSNYAIIDIISTLFGPWERNSNSYFALFKWENGRWKFIARN